MKPFERVVLGPFSRQASVYPHPLQSAYGEDVGVDAAGSIIGLIPDLLQVIMEQSKELKIVMQNEDPPTYSVFSELKSCLSGRLVGCRCSSERFRKFSSPAVVNLFKEHRRWLLLLTRTTMLMTGGVDVLRIVVILVPLNILMLMLHINTTIYRYIVV